MYINDVTDIAVKIHYHLSLRRPFSKHPQSLCQWEWTLRLSICLRLSDVCLFNSKRLVSSVTMRRRHSSSWFLFSNRSWRAIFAWRSFVLSWHSEEPIRQRSEVECPGSMQLWRAQLLPKLMRMMNDMHKEKVPTISLTQFSHSLCEKQNVNIEFYQKFLQNNPREATLKEKDSNRLHDDTIVHDNASSHSSSCARICWQLWRGNFVLSSLISWSHSVWLHLYPVSTNAITGTHFHLLDLLFATADRCIKQPVLSRSTGGVR